MELGVREWFLIVGGVLIIGVLAHGLWITLRARRAERSGEGDVPDADDIDLLRAELPNGGARVVAREDDPGDGAPAGSRTERRAGTAQRRADPIDRDVETGAAGVPAPSPATDAAPPVTTEQDEPEPAMEQAPLFAGEPIAGRPERPRKRAAAASRRAKQPPAGGAGGRTTSRDVPEAPAEPAADAERRSEFELVLVIYVLCREGEVMDGSTLLEAVSAQGLQFGDMNIFHRYGDARRQQIDFSLASAVEPGTFDLSSMENFSTPGVILFMQLPGPADPLGTYEDMVDTAKALAEAMDAELRDENHSVMTAQTIEHDRQRIREFRRRQMSRRA